MSQSQASSMQPSSTSWCLRLRRADSSSLSVDGIRSEGSVRCIRMISWSKRLKIRYVGWYKMKWVRLPKRSSCSGGMSAGSGLRGSEKGGQGGHLISGRGCHIYLYYYHRILGTLLHQDNILLRSLMLKTSRI